MRATEARTVCKRAVCMFTTYKVIFSQACVIPSVHGGGGGVGLTACITGHMMRGSASRGESASGRRSASGEGGLHPGGGLQPAGGLHPGGSASRGCWTDPPKHYRIRLISRRYTSYWNAFLYMNVFLFSGIYMLFQMFSIASVMLFGAIVVNLYHYTGETLLSRSSRRKLIRTMAPLARVDIPKQLLGDTSRKTETEKQDMNGSVRIHEMKQQMSYEEPEVDSGEQEVGSGSSLETMVTEWQTIALIMDRIFLCFWAVTNITALILIVIVLK